MKSTVVARIMKTFLLEFADGHALETLRRRERRLEPCLLPNKRRITFLWKSSNRIFKKLTIKTLHPVVSAKENSTPDEDENAACIMKHNLIGRTWILPRSIYRLKLSSGPLW